MGHRNPIEKGIRREWIRKLGHQGFPPEFGGVRKQGASNPLDQPRILENARHTALGPIKERPGQTKVDNAMTAPVNGIFDPTLSGGRGGINDPTRNISRLLVKAVESGSAKLSLGSYTPEESTSFQAFEAVACPSPSTFTPCTIYRHTDGTLYLGSFAYTVDGSATYYIDLMRITPWGPPGLGIVPQFRLPGGSNAARRITSFCSLLGKLHFTLGTSDIAFEATTKTYSFDGTQATEEDSVTWVAGDGPINPIVVEYREQLVVAHYNGAFPPATKYKVRHRNYAGTWSNGAMTDFDPANSSFIAFDAAVYKDKLYVAGLGNRFGVDGFTTHAYIMVYDGTTWSIARNIGTSLAACSLRVFAGFLYYGHSNTAGGAGGAGSARIGHFDGTAWTDNHFDFMATFSGTGGGGNRPVVDMCEYMGNLYVAILDATIGVRGVYESPGTLTASGWVKVVASASMFASFGVASTFHGIPSVMAVMP